MWERTKEIIRKEFRQSLRDPRMRVLLLAPPLIQLLIFGYAVNLDVEHTRIGWIDMDDSPESRELRSAFEASSYFQIEASVSSRGTKESYRSLDKGTIQAIVQVLPAFSRQLHREGKMATIQILVDGTNSNTAGIVANYASQVVSAYTTRVESERRNARIMARTGGATGPPRMNLPRISVESRVWFNPNVKSRNYFVPGIVVNIIALVTIMLTAMSIVREKEIGTMEQLMVTPIRPIELMVGKMCPFAMIGLIDVALITAAALIIFRIPFRGSALTLFGCASLFILTTLGVGLFISTVSRTQQQAMMSSFFFFMPAFMLSGFAFPIRNMPEWVQYTTFLNPLRYFMEIVRGVFLKGVGLEYLWPQALTLAVFGVVTLLLSALRFRKRLD